MIVHTLLYVILSVLTATAVFAAGAPLNKSPQEHVEPGEEEKDSSNSL